MKKAACLIGFAVLLYVGVRNMDVVLQYLGLLWSLMFPFILGCAIAFVLNVPMKFMEKHLFEKARRKGNKAAIKLGRPISLLLSILFVVAIVLVVALVVIPELSYLCKRGKTDREKHSDVSGLAGSYAQSGFADRGVGKFYRFPAGKDVGFSDRCAAKRCE